MALDKNNLIIDFKKTFDLFLDSSNDVAEKLIEDIVNYLKNIEISYVPNPGLDSNGVADPNFKTNIGEMSLSDLSILNDNDFLKDSLKLNFSENIKKSNQSDISWELFNLAFKKYVETFVRFKSSDGYESFGKVESISLNLFEAFNVEKSNDTQSLANNLATEIHNFFINSKFKGSYSKRNIFNSLPNAHESNFK